MYRLSAETKPTPASKVTEQTGKESPHSLWKMGFEAVQDISKDLFCFKKENVCRICKYTLYFHCITHYLKIKGKKKKKNPATE